MMPSDDVKNEGDTFEHHERRNAALIIAILVLVVYGRSLAGDSLIGGADVVRSAYPIRDHFWSIVQRGELPTWSPFLMGGYPIIIEEQASPFYPAEWLFGLIQTPATYNLIIAMHTWLAGFGAYLLARKLNLSPVAAWLIVVAVAFGAPLSARVAAGHPSHFYSRVLMIWALLAILHLARQPNWWSALGLAMVFGAQLLIGIGNYQSALYNGMVSLLFGVFVLFNRVARSARKRFVVWGVTALILAGGLGACRAVVTLDVGMQSNRQRGLSMESLNYGALPPIMLTGYFLPHTFDDPSITDYTWPEFALYVGAATIGMALYAIRKRWRDPAVMFWIVIAALFLILCLGERGGLFSLFVKYVPGYQLFRNPARHGMIASLAVTLLAGYGCDALCESTSPPAVKPSHKQRAISLAGIIFGLVILIIVATSAEPSGASLTVLPFRFARGAMWFFSALVVFYLALRLYRTMPEVNLAGLLVGVVALDLVLYAYPQVIQGTDVGNLPYLVRENFPKSELYSIAYLEQGESADWDFVNVAADNGLMLLNMYTGVLPSRMTRVINILTGRPASEGQEENQIVLDAIARPDVLDYLGVGYLLIDADQQMVDDPSLREERSVGGFRCFENGDAMPFAFMASAIDSVSSSEEALDHVARAHDLRLEAAVVEGTIPESNFSCPQSQTDSDDVSDIRFEGGDVWLNVHTTQSGMLVVNQTYLDGWKGWVDNEPTPVYAVNYRWLGVYLSCPGDHRVHLRYFPDSLRIGLFLSSFTIFSVVVCSIAMSVYTSRRRKAEFPPTG